MSYYKTSLVVWAMGIVVGMTMSLSGSLRNEVFWIALMVGSIAVATYHHKYIVPKYFK